MSREDITFASGLVLIVAGLLGWDWRIASIVTGIAICGGTWYYTWKAANGNPQGLG